MPEEIICLDMDNTILYSDRVHIAAFQRAFRKNGLPKVPPAKLKELFGLIAKEMIRIIFPDIKPGILNRVVRDHDRSVVNDTAKYARVIHDVKKSLNLLKRQYKLALLSNCKHVEVIAILKAAGIKASTFSAIVGNDDVARPKPDPEEIRRAMKKAGLSKGYMVGDTVYDIRAGKAAGLKTIAVLTGHHSRKRLKKENPDYILKSAAGLPRLLLGQNCP